MRPCKEIILSQINAERFWSFVDRSGGEKACWEWQGARQPAGYGSYGGLVASRIAYALAFDNPPLDMMVCHKCDNPPCCNPSHLSIGTGKENNHDAAVKGRAAKGNPDCVLRVRLETEVEIVKLMIEGLDDNQIGESLCIPSGMVRKIRKVYPKYMNGGGRAKGDRALACG